MAALWAGLQRPAILLAVWVRRAARRRRPRSKARRLCRSRLSAVTGAHCSPSEDSPTAKHTAGMLSSAPSS
eukprot:11148688-Lingulodinium_polyedra.AAC.1